MRQVGYVLTALTGLIVVVVAPGLGALMYIHTHWGAQGVLVAGSFFVGLPFMLLVGVLLVAFLLASQRIWASSADAQADTVREMYRTVTQGVMLQRQRERLDAQTAALPDSGPRPALPQWTVVPEDAWRDPADVPQLADFRIER